MRFTVLDVGHGFCAFLVADNGNLMLFDCGDSDSGEQPSNYLYNRLGQRSVERLFITNYDQDHISDVVSVRQILPVRILHRNRSIDAAQLRALKLQSGPLTLAMESLIQMIGEYSSDERESSTPPAFPDVEWMTYSNDYGVFQDTNNLSSVTFLTCRGVTFLIPGDLETAGWKELLKQESFRAHLATVNVFIASHHGRENGYCRDVFSFCSPQAVVFSDGPMKYATQEMASTYASHATGTAFNGETRYVLSTRKDGTFEWNL